MDPNKPLIRLSLALVIVALLTGIPSSGICSDKPRREKGHPCEGDEHCKPGLACIGQKCRVDKAGEGEVCWASRDLYPYGSTHCRDGLLCMETNDPKKRLYYCERDNGTGTFVDERIRGQFCLPAIVGVCARKRKAGESCQRESDCAHGLTCLIGALSYCSGGEKGHVCNGDDDCKGDLLCVGNSCR